MLKYLLYGLLVSDSVHQSNLLIFVKLFLGGTAD